LQLDLVHKILSFGKKIFESPASKRRKMASDRQVVPAAKNAKTGDGITATFFFSATSRRLLTPGFVTIC
jgi:hypothetical protein